MYLYILLCIWTKGLADSIFSKQPDFSLISNGAECIMIDKRFYFDHVPQLLMNRLRDDVSHQHFVFDPDLQIQYRNST